MDGPNPFPTIKKAAGFLQAPSGIVIITKASLYTTTQCSLNAGTEHATVSGHIISTYPTGETRKNHRPRKSLIQLARDHP